MIILIKSNKLETIIYKSGKTKEITNDSPTNYINDLCLKKLFDLRGYKLSIKHILQIDKKIPIYIDKETLLIPLKNLKDDNQLYINFYALNRYDIYQKSVKIYMCDNIVVVYNKTISSLKRLLQISHEIIRIKEGT